MTRRAACVLTRIRRLIRTKRWKLTGHALGDLADNLFERRDVESSILGGAITKSEPDELGVATDGLKHTIVGPSSANLPFVTTGKIVQGFDDIEYLVITACERSEQ